MLSPFCGDPACSSASGNRRDDGHLRDGRPRSAEDRTAAREACFRPQLPRIVVDLEGRTPAGRATQGSFERVKMCTSGVSAAGSSSVPTRMKRSSGRPPYSLHSAVRQAGQRWMVCGRPESVGTPTPPVTLKKIDPIRLDQRVDDEGAAGLPLAVAAMAAMHEHRGGQPRR